MSISVVKDEKTKTYSVFALIYGKDYLYECLADDEVGAVVNELMAKMRYT